LRESPQLASAFRRKKLGWNEIHLGGDLTFVVRCVKRSYSADSGDTGDKMAPEGFTADPVWGDYTQPRNDNSARF
jgi:hypothetical protein